MRPTVTIIRTDELSVPCRREVDRLNRFISGFDQRAGAQTGTEGGGDQRRHPAAPDE